METAAQDPGVVIIGAGPSGLSCADVLLDHGIRSTVIERNDMVGGLGRSLQLDGFTVDCGNHQLAAANPVIRALVAGLLGDDVEERQPRVGMIWRNRRIGYPVRLAELVGLMSPGELVLAGFSFARTQLARERSPRNYAEVMRASYGHALYQMFFRGYLQKVWGEDPDRLSPNVQSGRARSVWRSLIRRNGSDRANDAAFISKFGQGALYARLEGRIRSRGGTIELNSSVDRLHVEDAGVVAVELQLAATGERRVLPCRHLVSTMPLPHLVRMFDGEVRDRLQPLLQGIRARHVLIVFVVFRQANPFPEQCLYVADVGSPLVRITNFTGLYGNEGRNPGRTMLCCEYWIDQDHPVWTLDDATLATRTAEEVRALPLGVVGETTWSRTLRFPFASPVYDLAFEQRVMKLSAELAGIRNLHLLGRSGSFAYIDQDQAILSGHSVGERLATQLRL